MNDSHSVLLERILNALKALGDGRSLPQFGICDYLECSVAYAARRWLAEQFPHWPEFSGYEGYPIFQYGAKTPNEAFWAASLGGYGWDKDHPYGAARWRLVDFLIARAEAEMAQRGTA